MAPRFQSSRGATAVRVSRPRSRGDRAVVHRDGRRGSGHRARRAGGEALERHAARLGLRSSAIREDLRSAASIVAAGAARCTSGTRRQSRRCRRRCGPSRPRGEVRRVRSGCETTRRPCRSARAPGLVATTHDSMPRSSRVPRSEALSHRRDVVRIDQPPRRRDARGSRETASAAGVTRRGEARKPHA